MIIILRQIGKFLQNFKHMKKIAFIFFLLPFISHKVFAQLNGYNLMEFQYGNLPDQGKELLYGRGLYRRNAHSF